MLTIKKRLGAFVGAAALAVGFLAMGASPASAEDGFSFVYWPQAGDDYYIGVTNTTEGAVAGYGWWQSDPSAEISGDTIVAHDNLADGYGIVTHLSTGRVASTAGYPSPYTAQASGNLTEGNTYTMWVCAVKGSWSTCSNHISVTA